jgi:pyruvate/2-oxoglutarate dehydrogenase complex dihydrolipoamide dehydrogenase (E3) component
VFTSPEIGQAGLTEPEARARDGTVRVHRWPLEWIDRAQTADERDGFLKLIARRDGRLLGATVVASVAGELVNAVVGNHADRRCATCSNDALPRYSLIQQAAADPSPA